MATSFTMYKCAYCNKTLKTEKGINEHEKNCDSNPNKLKIKERIEEIRCNAISVEHLIKSITDFLLELGIKLTLTSYPSIFNEMVSNSHNSPKGYKTNWGQKKSDIPLGYPGWKGTWEGTIEVIDKSILGFRHNKCYFSDLKRGIDTTKDLNLWFIKTGSGGEAKNFRYDGMLFLYDFPKMHQEYINKGGAITDLNNEYISALDIYYEKYKKAKENSLLDNKDLKYLKNVIQECDSLRKETSEALQTCRILAETKFNASYCIPLPMPPSAFIKDAKKAEIFQEVTYLPTATTAPSLEHHVNRLKDIVKRMKEMQKSNPEYFL